MAVAHPDPALPKAGRPQCPKISTQLRMRLSGTAMIGTTITTRVRKAAVS
jgi:hypothetical protein